MDDFSLDQLTEKQLLRLAKYYKIDINNSKSVLEAVKKHLKINQDGSIEKIQASQASQASQGGARTVFYKVI